MTLCDRCIARGIDPVPQAEIFSTLADLWVCHPCHAIVHDISQTHATQDPESLELILEARPSVEEALLDDLRYLTKAQLRSYSKTKDEARALQMLRAALPPEVTEEDISKESVLIGDVLHQAAEELVQKPNYRPRKRKPASTAGDKGDDIAVDALASNGSAESDSGNISTYIGLTQIMTEEYDEPESEIDNKTISSPHSSQSITQRPTALSGDAIVDNRSDDVTSGATTSCTVFCVPGCNEGGNCLQRCSMCYQSYHGNVEGYSEISDSGLLHHVCHVCRNIGRTVKSLHETIIQLQSSMTLLINSNVALVNTMDKLKGENEQLTKQVIKLSVKQEQYHTKNSKWHAARPEVPDLLIGDSMLRDIKVIDTSKLAVDCQRGAKTCDVTKTLKHMKDSSVADVMIHIGTNDCATKFPIDKIAANITTMISHAKRVSATGHVTFSSICPRMDNATAAAKAVQVNQEMKQLAEGAGCVYLCHDGTFFCQNGEVNEEYLVADGLHLSESGTQRLLKNFKITSAAACVLGYTHPARSKLPPKPPHKTVLTKNYDAAPRVGAPKQASRPWKHPSNDCRNGNSQPAAARRSTNDRQSRRVATGNRSQSTRQPSNGGRLTHTNYRAYDYDRDSDRYRASDYSRDSDNYNSHHIASNGRYEYCRKCGETNHRTNSCKYDYPITCFTCHREGHKQKYHDLYAF